MRPAPGPSGAELPSEIGEGERKLLKSIVDFGDTLVREVMTPRPDIVAIPEVATIGQLRNLFREQEYSRFPVFKDSLDNIAASSSSRTCGVRPRRRQDPDCSAHPAGIVVPRPSWCRTCCGSSRFSRRSARSSWTSTAALRAS